MNKCGGCGKFLAGGAACSKCKTLFHRQCVNLGSNQSVKNWLCPSCASVPHKDNTDTPVKGSGVLELESSPEGTQETEEDRSSILQELRALRQDMNELRRDIGSLSLDVKNEIKELKDIHQECNEKLDHFAERIDDQESRLTRMETLCKEVPALILQVQSLTRELQNKEQMSLRNDIEISGVTEHRGENILHVTGTIMTKIGLTLDERDVVEAHRVGPPSRALNEGGVQRPRPIIVRFTRHAVHQQVLRSARARRHLSTSDIEVAGTSRPIYINERLTKQHRIVFGRARSLCKEHKWKYAWTKEGNVFIRQQDGQPASRIRSDEDLNKIFKSRPV